MRLPMRLERLSPSRWVVTLLALVVVSRLAWLLALPERSPRFDERVYLTHAIELLEGKGYVNEVGRPTAFDPVGYPLVLSGALALVGAANVANAVVQIIAAAATCALVNLLGASFLGVKVGRLAALLMALYPNHVTYVSLFLSEPLFAALLLATLALLLGARGGDSESLAAAGIALGLASLVRPTMPLFPLFLVPWFRWQGAAWRRAVTGAILLGGVALLTLLPWLVRNRMALGQWTICTKGGQNFWAGNYSRAFGGYARPRAVDAAIFDGVEFSSREGYRRGLKAVASDPVAAVARGAAKLSYFFALETDGVLWNLKGSARGVSRQTAAVLVGVVNLAYVGMVVLALLALCARWRAPAFTSMFLILTGYLALVSVTFFGDPRYHFPLVPLAALLAAEGFVTTLPGLREGLRTGAPQARATVRLWLLLCLLFGALVAGNLAVKYLEFVALGPH